MKLFSNLVGLVVQQTRTFVDLKVGVTATPLIFQSNSYHLRHTCGRTKIALIRIICSNIKLPGDLMWQ